MACTIKLTSEIRDRLHNLDIDNVSEHMKIYEFYRYLFIKENEDVSYIAYDDKDPKGKSKVKLGNMTVGIGFNMERGPSSKIEWEEAFGSSVSFDDVLNKKRELTEEEVKKLFDVSMKIRLKEIKVYYKLNWEKLKPNERLMIEDAYFNGPSLVTMKRNEKNNEEVETNFLIAMKNYALTGEEHFREEAEVEIKDNSNKKKIKGLQNRRNVQYLMLKSSDCPLYTLPNQPPIPLHPKTIRAKIGETIIPRDHPTVRFGTYKSPRFYIWRTAGDNKVRTKHAENDGRIFDVNHPPAIGFPGKEKNCRCTADFNIPNFVEITENEKAYMNQIIIRKIVPVKFYNPFR